MYCYALYICILFVKQCKFLPLDNKVLILIIYQSYPKVLSDLFCLQMKKRLWKTLESGKFAKCPIVAVAAKPGGPEVIEASSHFQILSCIKVIASCSIITFDTFYYRNIIMGRSTAVRICHDFSGYDLATSLPVQRHR